MEIDLCEKNINLIAAYVTEKASRKKWKFVGIYGDPERSQNPRIWENIESHMQEEDEAVCLVGDFNSIAAGSEKWGGNSCLSSQNRAFRAWIHGAGLIDLGHQGPAYTWSNNQQGSSMICERLDRALANLAWTMENPKTAVFHIPRFQSDHLPVLIRTKPQPLSKKKRFRSENWWLSAQGFDGVCERVGQAPVRGWQEMTTRLKKEVKQWEKSIKSPNQMLSEIEKEIKSVDLVAGGQVDRCREQELQKQHAKVLAMQEAFYHQRARINWAASGDRNSAFFHAAAAIRKRKNTIRSIMVEEGVWETGEREVRRIFLNYFRNIFSKGNRARIEDCFEPDLLASFPKVPLWAHSHLEAIPTLLEIQKALFSLGPDKAAGPDGINARLLQEKWALFGPTVIQEVSAFFQTGHLPSVIARSNLILIPKKEEPKLVSDFRPISVCNTIYKVI